MDECGGGLQECVYTKTDSLVHLQAPCLHGDRDHFQLHIGEGELARLCAVHIAEQPGR